AQFAVASELCKRGYEVSFTMGNSTPFADLMVVSPGRSMFLIDVKGLCKKNPWLVSVKAPRKNLFYIFAFVPTGVQNRFFIMTQLEAENYIKAELKRLGRPDDYSRPGIAWDLTLPHEDQWAALPK